MKAPGRNAEAADWRRGARDYGWMRARARLCMSPPPDRSDLDPKQPRRSHRVEEECRCVCVLREDAHEGEGVHTEGPSLLLAP